MNTLTIRAPWIDEDVELNIDNLTEMEIKVMRASRKSDYCDVIDDATWTFDVQDKSGVPANQFRGVCSSLIKKSLISITIDGNDSYFALTKQGKLLFSDYKNNL